MQVLSTNGARLCYRIYLLGILYCASLTECIHRRFHIPSRSLAVFGQDLGPDQLVNVLRSRGDNLAETNAHRIILSVDTASNFINDVLESAMTKTFHSAISSRENLFFSLQRTSNDSRRIFELVDRATNVVSDTAKKAKTEINEAIKTSLDHLRESMKIIIRNVPESKLTDVNIAAIISNGQYRMEVVVENSGQRIIDAIQSYRSHFIAIDKDTGNVMVDPESSQEATEAVKHIITAAKSQIQEAVSGSTSFILSRIRDCLSSNLNDERVNTTATTVGSVMVTVSLGNGSSETFQAEVISVHQTQMEDPSDDKMVQMGEMPKQQTEGSWTTTATTAWESPMVINTRWTTATPLPIDGAVNSTVLDNSSATTASPNTTTSRLISWQDDIPKGSFPAVLDGNLNSESQLKTTETPVVAITERSVDILGNVTNVPSDFNTTAATSSLASTSTTVTTTILTQVPLIRRRIQQIKPIVSGKGSR